MNKIEPDFTVLVTGITGSGKSAACNFFLQQNAFLSRRSFSSVTKAAQYKEGTVGGKYVALIDTPGFLDPCSTTEEDELEELAKAIISVPNGIHALGVVIDITSRISTPVAKTLEQLLEFVELVPYAFVIFSHAKELAESDKGQKTIAEEMIKETESSAILSRVLESVNNRYIVLESVKDMAKGYHDVKVNELTQTVDSILAIKKKPFTCCLTDVAKRLQENNVNLEERIRAAKHDLKQLQNQLQIEKQDKSQLAQEKVEISARSFWQKWSIYIATGAGAAVGAAIVPVAGGAVGAGLAASYLSTLVGGGAAVGGAVGGGIGVAMGNMCIIQ